MFLLLLRSLSYAAFFWFTTRMCDSTWEWAGDAQIRGFAHPGLFALLYKALALLVRACLCMCIPDDDMVVCECV